MRVRKFIGILTETTADAKIKVKKCIETETGSGAEVGVE